MCIPNQQGVRTPMQQTQQAMLIPAENKVQSIEKQLTPAEMSIVNYHRQTIKEGKVGKDPQGNPITVFSNTIEIPSGKDKGKFVTVPGWFDGKAHSADSAKGEQQLYNKWKGEIEQGKWPVYSDPKAADDRAKFIHGIMDAEGGRPQ